MLNQNNKTITRKLPRGFKSLGMCVSLSILITFALACGGGGGGETEAPKSVLEDVQETQEAIKGIQELRAELSKPTSLIDEATRERMNNLIQGKSKSHFPINRSKVFVSKPLAQAPFRAKNHFVYYGDVTPEAIQTAKRYDLVILTSSNLTRAIVEDIQKGFDENDSSDDVKVLLYVSIGEDLRTVGVTDTELLLDPRFRGDGTGPRVDPRGVYPNGNNDFENISLLGNPSPGGSGYASYYLDDNDVVNNDNNGLGKPDRNVFFGGCFVNAGDPNWFETVDQMSIDGPDRLIGLREAITLNYGRGLGADGVFLDTVDTAAPNYFTDSSSPNQSEYEWTAPGMSIFIKRIRERYPESLILQNRGLFYFHTAFPHFKFNARSEIDFLLFESFRLNSDSHETYNPYFHADNRYNFSPQLSAEANRNDGFQVLTLGYAEGPGISLETLHGTSQNGLEELLEDIRQTEIELGFKHFLSNKYLDDINTFVLDQIISADNLAPVWTSSKNDRIQPFPEPALSPTPKVGLQMVTAIADGVRLHWDVAIDQNPVSYRVYYQSKPFDFSAANPFADSENRKLKALSPYDEDIVGNGLEYSHTDTITGLSGNETWHFLIRAEDELGYQDNNRVVRRGQPLSRLAIDGDFREWAAINSIASDDSDALDSAGPDYLDLKTTQDAEHLFVYFNSDNAYNLGGSPTFSYSRSLIFIDIDNNPNTGWPMSAYGIGSDIVINGAHLFRQSASQFNNGYVMTLNYAQQENGNRLEMAIPLIALKHNQVLPSSIKLLAYNDQTGDSIPNIGESVIINLTSGEEPVNQNFSIDENLSEWNSVSPVIEEAATGMSSSGPDWTQIKTHVNDDGLYVYYQSSYDYGLDGYPDFAYPRTLFFLDLDESKQTGYSINQMGSELLLSGAQVYSQSQGLFNTGYLNSLSVLPLQRSTSREMLISNEQLKGAGDWIRFQAVNDEAYDFAPDIGYHLRINRFNNLSMVVPASSAKELHLSDGYFSDWSMVPAVANDIGGEGSVSGPDWLEAKMDNDSQFMYFYTKSNHAYRMDGFPQSQYSRTLIFIDVDDNPETGYAINGIGSDMVINGNHAFRQSKEQFAFSYLGPLGLSTSERVSEHELEIPLSYLKQAGAQAGKTFKIFFLNDESFDYMPNLGNVINYKINPEYL